ncbi:MAG: DNRLRE domain-containing protein [Chitinophagaceae bacterium]|nr:DNRLRE domain-containing protein [Chitinophagaceae bacterium]
MKRFFRYTAVIIVCVLLFNEIQSQTGSSTTCITIRGNKIDGRFKQAHLLDIHPNIADTTQPELVAAAWTCNGQGFPTCNSRGVFRYELAEIPTDALIISARLYLYAKVNNINGNPGSPTFGTSNTALLQKVTAPWSLSTITWNNQPTITSTGQIVLPQSTSTTQNYIADVKDVVQEWVTDPSSNNGWLFRLQTESFYNSMIFHSGSISDTSLQPKLEICYVRAVTLPTGCLTIRGNKVDGKFRQAHLFDIFPNNADTTQPELVAAAWTCNGQGFPTCNSRGVFRYDLSEIPVNAVVTSAKLYLYAKTNNLNGNPGSPTFGNNNTALLQKVVSPWTLSTITWNNQPSVTTAQQVFLPQSSSSAQNYVADVKDVVQSWVIDPSTNYGWLFRLQTENFYNSMIFHSGSTTDTTLQPKLEVCYYLNPPLGTNPVSGGSGSGFHKLSVYPNPTRGAINLNIVSEIEDFAEITILDMYSSKILFRMPKRQIAKGENIISFNAGSQLSAYRYYLIKVRFSNEEQTVKIFSVK